MLDAVINFLNDIFWSYILIYGLIAVGLFFTIRLGFVQFVNFGEMFRAVLGSKEHDRAGITPFQALCTSLASRVGTGNLTGVAVALYLGGPGAIFWMWVVALVGMTTAYAESTLAQLYRSRTRTVTIAAVPHSTSPAASMPPGQAPSSRSASSSHLASSSMPCSQTPSLTRFRARSASTSSGWVLPSQS